LIAHTKHTKSAHLAMLDRLNMQVCHRWPAHRKSDIQKMRISFSCKARIRQQIFTSCVRKNCSALLHIYQFLFSPAHSTETWFASCLVSSLAEGARTVGTMLMGKEETTVRLPIFAVFP